MIKRLMLEDFGKFKDTHFDFSNATLFLGKNESGKTTIFDALFQETCHPRANRRYGRQLQQRYGESRRAQLKWSGDEPRFDEDEFYNLLAIRSGDVYLDMASGSTWMEKVKSGLFTGGIDPLRLQKTFADRASDKGSFKHNRDQKQLEEDLSKLGDRLEDRRNKRDSLLSRESDTRILKNKLDSLQTDHESKTAEMSRIEKELEYEGKIQEKGKLNNLLLKIRDGVARQKILESLESYTGKELARMDDLRSGIAQLELDSAKVQTDHDHQRELLKERQKEVVRLREAMDNSSNLSRLATEYLDSLKRIRENLPRRRTSWWHWLVLAVLSALVAASVLLSLNQENILFFLISVGLGTLLGVFFLLLIGRIRTQPDLERIGDTVQRLKEEWRDRTGGSAILTSDNPDGLARELETLRSAADRDSEAVGRANGELRERAKSLEESKERREELIRQMQTGESSIADWLKRADVRNRDEYYRKTLDRQRLQQEQSRWEEELEAECKNRGMDSVSLLQQECERRLRDFDHEHIPNRGKSEEEIHRLQRDLKEKSGRIDAVSDEHRRVALMKAQQQGEISGSLGSLPQEIADLERSILERKELLKAMEIDKLAAHLVREIFEKIAVDTENVLVELGRELAFQFGEIVPEMREISLTGLSTESIAVADAGGASRPIGHLSSGTRDAFLFAARMALARRGHPERALLILDEPFHALDEERVGKTLAMIRKFQLETQWQIVLFSKETELEGMCREVFPHPHLTVHTL